MIFSSAYATMLGVFTPLVTPETALVSDELNHNCIINAIRLARPKEKRVYRHNDMADFAAKLAEVKGCRRALVVTDGIFSMRGDAAPLAGGDEDRPRGRCGLSRERGGHRRRLARRRRVRRDGPRDRGGAPAPARPTSSSARSARRSASTAATSPARQGADRFPARVGADLHLLESDHAGRGGRGARRARGARRSGRRRPSRPSRRDDRGGSATG